MICDDYEVVDLIGRDRDRCDRGGIEIDAFWKDVEEAQQRPREGIGFRRLKKRAPQRNLRVILQRRNEIAYDSVELAGL